jgi:hypothetical protein
MRQIYIIKNYLNKWSKNIITMDKEITNLKKQNDGMEIAFNNKNIKFNKLNIDNVDLETELLLLKKYNEYLKDISKNNRPPPQEKPKVVQKQTAPKKAEEEDDEDDVPKEVKPVYSTIVNMEDIKRAFFNKEYETFNALIRQHPLKYYEVNYKYASDNTGRPGYVAKNLLRGFVQGLDDYRKYLMVCFRCLLINKESNEYNYPSYWILNSNDDIKTVLGSLYDDYDFIMVEKDDDITNLLKKMEKNENEEDDTLIGEIYLH